MEQKPKETPEEIIGGATEEMKKAPIGEEPVPEELRPVVDSSEPVPAPLPPLKKRRRAWWYWTS